MQKDFAARADWCVMPPEEANHPPVVQLDHPPDLTVKPGTEVKLSARGSFDPDGDEFSYKWWYYGEAGTFDGEIRLINPQTEQVTLIVPNEETELHLVCEVEDTGDPQLTRYARVIINVEY